MAELFGFQITRVKKQEDPKQSFTTTQADDGTQTVAAGGYFGQYLDMEGTAKTEQDLIYILRSTDIDLEKVQNSLNRDQVLIILVLNKC